MNSISKNVMINLKNFLLLVFSMLLIGAPFLYIYAVYPDLFHSISFAVSQHRWFFRLLRWGFIFTFILAWPYLLNWVGRNANLSQEEIIAWQAERFRIAVWLILFELLIGENMIFKLIHAG